MAPKKAAAEGGTGVDVVRKLIDVPHTRLQRHAPHSSPCCCGRGTGGSNSCARVGAASSSLDDSNSDGGSRVDVASCCCPESASSLFPPLVAGALDMLLRTAVGSPVGSPNHDYMPSLLWPRLQLLPITRSAWTAAMGEYDVIVDASGVLADLLHDAILPEVAHLERCGVSSSTAATPMTSATAVDDAPQQTAYNALGCGKLDALLGMLWSVAVHVTKQPMLNHHCGPTALVLCATQAQCDEVSWILDCIAGPLSLVVHNTFEPFPLMPDERRADVVVSTPLDVLQHFGVASPFVDAQYPLHRVSALAGAQRAQERSVTPLGGANVSASSKRYQLDAVAQLAVVDVDGIRRIGSAPLVDAILGSHLRRQQASTVTEEMLYHTHYTRGVLPSCQFQFVCATTNGVSEARRWLRVHANAKGITNERRSALVIVRAQPMCAVPHAVRAATPPDMEDAPSGMGRKRTREDTPDDPHDRCHVNTPLRPPSESAGAAPHWLMLRNCLSLAQIVRDPEIVEFVAADVRTCIPADLQSSLHVGVALLSIVGASTSAEKRGDAILEQPCEVVVLVRRSLAASFSSNNRHDEPLEARLDDALVTIAATFRGRLLEGQPIASVIVPEHVVRVVDATLPMDDSTATLGVLRLAVEVAAARTCDSQTEAMMSFARSVDVVCLDDAACRMCAAPPPQRRLGVPTPPAQHRTHGVDCFLSQWFCDAVGCGRSDTSTTHCTRAPLDRDNRLGAAHRCMGSAALSIDDAACWGISDCVLALRNIGPRTMHDAIVRRAVLPPPGPLSAASPPATVQPSVVETMLTLCQRVALVKSFLVHVDTGIQGEVTLFVEFWTVAAAQAAFVMLHRLATPPLAQDGLAGNVPFVVEWIRGGLFYEGAAADPADFDEMPHPLDR